MADLSQGRAKMKKKGNKKDIAHFLDKEQKNLLKGLRAQIRDLTDVVKLIAASQDVDAIRKEHMQFLGTVGSRMLSAKELEMAKEGISLDELRKICGRKMLSADRHDCLRDNLPHGHMLHMVYAEHELILYYVSDLEACNGLIQQMHGWTEVKKLLGKLSNIVKHLCAMDAHHVREERIIFPQLVAHGYGDTPQAIFAEHVQLRKARVELKLVADAVEKVDFAQWKQRLDAAVNSFVPAVREHVYKEETIVFPTALKVIQDPQKWTGMKTACDDIGICCF
jgi:uncharacterized protein